MSDPMLTNSWDRWFKEHDYTRKDGLTPSWYKGPFKIHLFTGSQSFILTYHTKNDGPQGQPTAKSQIFIEGPKLDKICGFLDAIANHEEDIPLYVNEPYAAPIIAAWARR